MILGTFIVVISFFLLVGGLSLYREGRDRYAKQSGLLFMMVLPLDSICQVFVFPLIDWGAVGYFYGLLIRFAFPLFPIFLGILFLSISIRLDRKLDS